MNNVMMLGPSLTAVSGVSTHLNQLIDSSLINKFELLHFQVGSQGRSEGIIQKLMRFIFSPLQFFWQMLNKHPSIVHINTTMDAKGFWRDLVYLIIARSFNAKIVYQIHGGALPDEFFKQYWFFTFLLKQTLQAADVVVVLGQDSFKAYREFSPNLKVEVIPNAIKVGTDPIWKLQTSACDEPLHLVYMGRLAESKGIFEIVEALAILQKSGHQMHLVIAGSGPDEARLRSFVINMNLQHYVSFVGVVHGLEKDRLWCKSDLFIFPTYREALPYALLESMAARTPALVSAVGAIPDVMEDGVHGLFIPLRNPQALAEAISRLDSDRALIRRMGESSRQRIVNHHTIDRLVDDFSRIYREILN